MKEVQFRMIDRVFIKMSINDKMWAIFALFFVTLTALAGTRYWQTIQGFETQAKLAVEYKLQGILSQANITTISGLETRSSLSEPQYRQGQAIATGRAKDV